MEINELRLYTQDLAPVVPFYQRVLGLPVIANSPEHQIAFQVGTSRLIFQQRTGDHPYLYHVAFNIPENQFRAAKAWLSQRLSLLQDSDGRDEFLFQNWDAHALYFADPAGNILELIARHTLDNGAAEPFGSKSLLSISEIGLAAPDVPRLVDTITSATEAAIYIGASDTFAAVGDERGMFIIVQHGRIWYPDTGTAAELIPLQVQFSTAAGTYQLTGYPYQIEPSHP